jgi:hypothetical protein
MATYGHTFTSGDTLTPTKLNAARTATDIVNADISASAAIAATKLASDSITNTQIKSDAAIAGTKIAPNFGGQDIVADGTSFVQSTSTVQRGSNVPETSANLVLQRQRSGGAIVQSGDTLGQLLFNGQDGTNFVMAARIAAAVDGTPGTDDMPGRLVFSTTADGGSSPAERMRITSAGELLVGTTLPSNSADALIHTTIPSSSIGAWCSATGTTSQRLHMRFVNPNGVVGSISTSASATAFTTSSDYRLKQNVEPMTGGLAKLAVLAPKTFEFKAEPNVKIDGFIAHEVQAIVPQAVTGEKDGEEMQGLDHSKLVPVLVAAVQELSAKVAALEAA